MKKLLRITIILLCTAVSAFAQAVNGSLIGTITDKDSKEPLIGATILIVGTYKGSITDINGKYEIKGIKPGDYTIKVTFIGYTEKIFNGIRIAKDVPTTLTTNLSEQTKTQQVVEIIGERNVVDLESGKSEVRIGATDIKEMNVRSVQDIVAMQAGVSQSPDGLQIRGGRVYETTYVVDGISAQDPLAGTGFGVGVGSNSLQDVTVVTGGSDAEYGGGTSGTIITRVKEGGDKFKASGSWQRDNLGVNKLSGPAWNTDLIDIQFGGPVAGTDKKLRYFVGVNAAMSDTYYKLTTDQLHSSILGNDKFWAPRMDNSYSNSLKLTYQLTSKTKISVLNQFSASVGQSTRTLQVVGNNQIMQPGLQWPFALDLDKATTYTSRNNLTVFNLQTNINNNWSFNLDAGRLFTNLRADANGRSFRSGTVDRIFDANSITTSPVQAYPINDTLSFTLNGGGLNNNGGIADVWHDHYVQEITVKYKFNYFSPSKKHFISFGQEHKEQEYQWVDISRPWVGAPIQLPDGTTTQSTSVGASSDIWRVKPASGGFFLQDEIRYKGIIATLGGRLEYWAPGKYIDDLVASKGTPILDETRSQYQNQTFGLDRRYKARFLPKLRVSFPVTENNVMYFNYGHSMRLPNPRFVYAGLDSNYANRSNLADLGNPNINPEVCVAYEVGIKSQITRDFGITFTAFYKDYFDYIVSRSVVVQQQGQFVTRNFFINQDYARIRGLEVALNYRFTKSVRATFNAAYQIATGKSNTAAESKLQIAQNGQVDLTKEQYLAFDRPFDFKGGLIFTPDSNIRVLGYSLKGFRAFVFSTLKSGLRYTPAMQFGTAENGRDIYFSNDAKPFANVGSWWSWTDIRLTRDFKLRNNTAISLSLEVKNIFNQKNAQIINPVTGTAYNAGDNLMYTARDPRYPSPQDNGVPPNNPARYTEPRHVLYGISFSF